MNAPTADPYELALAKAIADREQHGEELRRARQRVLEMEERDREFVVLARSLLRQMPQKRQSEHLARFPWLSDGPDPASRQAVLMAVATVFIAEPTREFTAPEIEQRLAMQGVHANSKRIYNTLNYLAADGRLKRASRGRYKAAGVAIGEGLMSANAEVF